MELIQTYNYDKFPCIFTGFSSDPDPQPWPEESNFMKEPS